MEHILARGNRNDNTRTFHVGELQVFAQPHPVCSWLEVVFTAKSRPTHSYRCVILLYVERVGIKMLFSKTVKKGAHSNMFEFIFV